LKSDYPAIQKFVLVNCQPHMRYAVGFTIRLNANDIVVLHFICLSYGGCL